MPGAPFDSVRVFDKETSRSKGRKRIDVIGRHNMAFMVIVEKIKSTAVKKTF